MSGLKDKLTNLGPTQRYLDAMPLPKGEPFPGETLVADGWQYRDLPRLPLELFDEFVSVVGEGNIRWLTLAEYGSEREHTKRGQMFISPQGLRNLSSWIEKSHG